MIHIEGKKTVFKGTPEEIQNDMANLMIALFADEALMDMFEQTAKIVDPITNPLVRDVIEVTRRTKEAHVIS
jgi:hypothetical protein